jgi:hypothetical protein
MLTVMPKAYAKLIAPQTPKRRWAQFSLEDSVVKVLASAIVMAALAGVTRLNPSRAEADDKPNEGAKADRKAERLQAMQKIAEAIRVESLRDDGTEKIGLVESARFRFTTPEINVRDATVWLWGTRGRPVALLTLSAGWADKDKPGTWSYELTSLSPRKLLVTSDDGWQWSPKEAGLDFKPLPGAQVPPEGSARRLRRMKGLARRFDAFGIYGEDGHRAELRILPTPIHRYLDEAVGVRDGALFFFASATNPEALLAIELSGDGADEPVWRYAINRVSAAELHARLDENEIWSCRAGQDATNQNSYYLFFRPMPRKLGDE